MLCREDTSTFLIQAKSSNNIIFMESYIQLNVNIKPMKTDGNGAFAALPAAEVVASEAS
jgi:hypothetical protein